MTSLIRWLASLELMRRAYLHAWALGTNSPIARAGHCVACAAALSDPADGAPLLDLLPALPPRVRASRDSREMADRWQLVPLNGACASEPGLRIVSIAAAGSGLAISSSDGSLILYKVCLARLAAGLLPPSLPPREGFALNSPILPWRPEGQYSRTALSRAVRCTYAEGRSSGGGPLLILDSVHTNSAHPQPMLSLPPRSLLAPSSLPPRSLLAGRWPSPLAEPAGRARWPSSLAEPVS